MRKIISIVLIFTLIFQFNTVSVLAEELNKKEVENINESNDTIKETSVLESLEFSSDTVKVGQALEITVKLTKEIEGISRVNAGLNIGNDYQQIELQPTETKGIYKFYLDIKEEMRYRKITISYLELNYSSGDYEYINCNDIETLAKVVDENGQYDNDAPILNSISFSKDTVKVGEKLDILVNVTDDLSGISYITGYLRIGDKYEYINFEPTDKKEIYKYTLEITESMKWCKILPSNLVLMDNTGNNNVLYEFDKDVFCKVLDENGDFDEEAPILNNINFNPNEVKVGDNLEITFDVYDNLSGIKYMYCYYYIGNEWRSVDVYKDKNNQYKMQIPITEDMIYKTIRFSYINIEDNTGNSIGYQQEELEKYTINVLDKNGQADNENPQINSITANKESLKVGEELILSVDVTDDTKIKNVYGEIYIGSSFNRVDFIYDETTEKYIYKLTVTKELEYKNITVQSIGAVDISGKNSYLYNYSGEYLKPIKIIDENGVNDDIAPTFNSISFNKNTIKVGDKLSILVSATDQLSGVSSVRGNLLIGNESRYVTFEPAEESGTYRYTLEIEESMKYCKIILDYLNISDRAGNTSHINVDELGFESCRVEDENNKIDDVEPILNSIKFNSKDIKVGDTLELTFDVSDNLSGVSCVEIMYSFGNGWYDHSYGDTIYKNEDNEYKLQIPVTEEMEYKNFIIRSIRIKDNAGNIKEFREDELTEYTIEVADKDGNFDTEDPKLNSITVDKTSVKVGEKFTITIDASDDTAIQRVIVGMRAGSDWRSLNFDYDENTGKYIAKVVATEEMKYQTLKIVEIIIEDKSSKKIQLMNYNNEYLEDIEITDESGLVDNEAPIFNGVSFSKEVLKVGEKLDILVNVTDDLSGIKYVSGNIRAGKEYIYVNFEPTENSGVYKYTLDITEDMKYYKISVDNLNIGDSAGNYTYVSKSEIKVFSKVVDENGKFDETAPKINSIKFSSEEVKVGDVLEVLFDVSDDLSGVSYIEVMYAIGSSYYSDTVYKNNNGEFKNLVYIQDYMLYNTLKINSIDVFDNSGNKLECRKSNSNGLLNTTIKITDESGMIDTKSPELVKFELKTNNPKVGENLEISIDAKDDVSGVKNIFLNGYVENYQGEDTLYIDLRYDETSKKYKGSLKILEYMKYKNIRFNVGIYDNSGRLSYYNHDELDIGNVTVTDTNGKVDNYSPIFKEISISKDKVNVGDKIDIIVDAIDNESGIESVEIKYSIFGYTYDSLSLKYDETIKKYKGTITASKDALYKMYTIDEIEITDKANNSIFKVFHNPYKIYVTDGTGKIDVDLPEVKNITVSKNEASVGEKIKVSLEASDKTSNIKSVIYEYSVDGKYKEVNLLYNSSTKKYEAEISIDESMKGKTILPERIIVLDDFENRTVKYDWNLQNLIVKVKGGSGQVEDTEGPKLLEINIDKNVVKPYEKVKISVDATDVSGVRWVEVDLNYTSLSLNYNETTKKYEGYIDIDEYEIYKKYKVKSITLTDNKYNRTYLYEKDFGDVSFIVSDFDGKVDNTKPVLKEWSIYKNKFTWNESPIIKVEFSDDLSGVYKVKIKAKNSYGSKTYSGEAYIHSKEKNVAYISLDGLSNSLVNEKILIEEITLIDFATNESVYTSDKYDFSKLTFIKGNYLEQEKVNVRVNSVYIGDETITGTVNLKNIGLRIYSNSSKVQILQEVISDSNGKFEFNISPNYIFENYIIEAYDIQTSEVLGYDYVRVNKSVDINGDGVVDIQDLAQAALNYNDEMPVKGMLDEKLEKIYKADINGDLRVDIFDLILISKKI